VTFGGEVSGTFLATPVLEQRVTGSWEEVGHIPDP
jgi:hypothetical protein